MSVQTNKEVVRRWNDAIHVERNAESVDELATPDYINHASGFDRATHKQQMIEVQKAFSDTGYTLEELVGEGDLVVMRATIHGVHTGTFAGVPATGKTITYKAMAMYRIAGGMIAEEWTLVDSLSVMRQLGLLPPED